MRSCMFINRVQTVLLHTRACVKVDGFVHRGLYKYLYVFISSAFTNSLHPVYKPIYTATNNTNLISSFRLIPILHRPYYDYKNLYKGVLI